MSGFNNSVDGAGRREHVPCMSVLLLHNVYTMRTGRINTHSYKLSIESLYKMAFYNTNIENISGAIWVFFSFVGFLVSSIQISI